MAAPTVLDMAEESTARHLRVVRAAARAVEVGAVEVGADESTREAYWAQVRTLRAERQRLRAG